MINRRGEKAAKAAGVVPLSPSIEEGFSFSSGSHERAGPGFVVDSFRAAARCRPPSVWALRDRRRIPFHSRAMMMMMMMMKVVRVASRNRRERARDDRETRGLL